MQPSIGRIVHYQTFSAGAVVKPAIIESVVDRDYVNLVLFTADAGTKVIRRVPFSETAKSGHWTWPPTVHPKLEAKVEEPKVEPKDMVTFIPLSERPKINFPYWAIAEACHEVNRILQVRNNEEPNPHWEELDPDLRESTIKGVIAAHEGATPEGLHESWAQERTAKGWVYGPVKDQINRTHPCLVPYAELPEEQRLKDSTFQSIVKALVALNG